MFFVCRADKRAEERRLRTGFNPTERPKSLRAKLYETLEMSVDHRYNIIVVRVAFTIVQQMVGWSYTGCIKKKLNRFEIALNFAKHLFVSGFLYI